MSQHSPENPDVSMSRSDERKLIARAKRGHADAYREIVCAYKDRLFAFVWRMVRDHHEAEDICQAAFVKAYESLSSYSDQYAFSTWLFTIAYRIGLNNLRKRKNVRASADVLKFDLATEDSTSDVANTEEARRLRDRIWAAVDELSAPQRSAVLLFYREGQSCQEIGQILGMPAVTVKSHLHRAREKLRTALSAERVGDWSEVPFFGDAASA